MPRLQPVELTDTETTRLMQAFIKGKTSVLEDDCMTLLKWAMAQRMGVMVLDMVLQGELRPVVRDGEVLVELAEPTA